MCWSLRCSAPASSSNCPKRSHPHPHTLRSAARLTGEGVLGGTRKAVVNIRTRATTSSACALRSSECSSSLTCVARATASHIPSCPVIFQRGCFATLLFFNGRSGSTPTVCVCVVSESIGVYADASTHCAASCSLTRPRESTTVQSFTDAKATPPALAAWPRLERQGSTDE